ncbi:MAG: tRNA (adenosine(37)-N6)-threonylcarbamoyltransferase complex ATPase subunit type 1 TsaE [Patescibacteria group bacterium]|nr:tRNA (adenosine(37)-N6)-threonylcarbamoyltransferase complex ATPase subunit type 1 TsaE [Patescibacteria group bacterium]
MQYRTKNESETAEVGRKTAAELNGGDILCLYGDLGAGKTTLVKGLARGLGLRRRITSPTFALMNIYDVRTAKDAAVRKLVHIDTYRLENERELVEIGIEDYLGAPNTICVIEWPEKIKGLLKNKKTLNVRIEHTKTGRTIVVNRNLKTENR